MNILLFGAYGQIGWELQRSLAPIGKIIPLGRNDERYCGDLCNFDEIQQSVITIRPDVVINAAAFTAVDKAESEHELANIVNGRAPGILAEAAKNIGALFVHYSTDYVYDGSGSKERKESDFCVPLNAYGRSKLRGDELVIASGCSHLIFRCSWIYASRGQNFLKSILKLASHRETLNVVDDQIGAPTGADLIADVTAHAVLRATLDPQLSGIYHLSASDSTSWYDYARFIVGQARDAKIPLKLETGNIMPISSEQYPSHANRPKNSLLDTAKLKSTFKLTLPSWKTGVARLINEMSDNIR